MFRESKRLAASWFVLSLAQAEGDETVRGIVRGEAYLNAVTRDYTDAETAHTARKLCGNGLT